MKKSIIFFISTIFAWNGYTNELIVNLNSYTDSVVNYSLQILQSKEKTTAMQEAMRLAKTTYLPKVAFSGSAQYRITNQAIDFSGTTLNIPHANYNVILGISQPIYSGGLISNTYKAAKIEQQITQQAEELTLDNVIYSARVNYWNAVAKKEFYKAMCDYVTIIASMEEVLKTRFNDGLIAKTDYLQIAARLKDAEVQKISTRASYHSSLQHLNIMMGREPLAPIATQDSVSTELPIPGEPMTLDTVILRRPDYAISLLNIDYQKRQIALAHSRYNPSISTGIQGYWGTKNLNLDGKTIFAPIAYLSLHVPIFEWGARNRAVASQKAILNSTVLEKQIAHDKIALELSTAWNDVTENTNQIYYADSSRVIAQENLEISTFSYNEGRIPIIDVLTAQLAWIQAQSNYIITRFQQKVAITTYKKVISE